MARKGGAEFAPIAQTRGELGELFGEAAADGEAPSHPDAADAAQREAGTDAALEACTGVVEPPPRARAHRQELQGVEDDEVRDEALQLANGDVGVAAMMAPIGCGARQTWAMQKPRDHRQRPGSEPGEAVFGWEGCLVWL